MLLLLLLVAAIDLGKLRLRVCLVIRRESSVLSVRYETVERGLLAVCLEKVVVVLSKFLFACDFGHSLLLQQALTCVTLEAQRRRVAVVGHLDTADVAPNLTPLFASLLPITVFGMRLSLHFEQDLRERSLDFFFEDIGVTGGVPIINLWGSVAV